MVTFSGDGSVLFGAMKQNANGSCLDLFQLKSSGTSAIGVLSHFMASSQAPPLLKYRRQQKGADLPVAASALGLLAKAETVVQSKATTMLGFNASVKVACASIHLLLLCFAGGPAYGQFSYVTHAYPVVSADPKGLWSDLV
jgi:hypothetical protein